MKRPTGSAILARIDRHLYDPRLDAEAQLRKRWAWVWTLATLIGVTSSIIYFLFILKLWALTWIGVVFIVGYISAFTLYPRVTRFDLVLNIIFSLFTLTAFGAMIETGGLTSSLGFVFVGINCAMGSVLAGNLRWTIGMFILYCTTIAVLGVLQPILQTPEYITPEINARAFVFLAVWINACILFIVILFMKDKSRFEKAEADKLRKIDEAKTKLFTNVSHEFRTPLTVIQGIAEQMEQHPGNWMQRGPGKIKTQSRILLRLVNQMLSIAKIEADEMNLNLIHGNLSKFIEYVVSSFQSLAESKQLTLTTDKIEHPVYTDYDPEKLLHVISNLLSNAIKFTPPGGSIQVKLNTTAELKRNVVQIIFRDTGRGIPRESMEHIFERFYQVPDSHDETPGTGLGLALSSELVKLMQGKIKVESQEGKGSVFTVVLPHRKEADLKKDNGISFIDEEIAQTELPHKKMEVIPQPTANDKSKKPVLLIVEDNHEVVEYLLTILDKQYQIELASNGKSGLEKALKIIPDIILSDVMMPQMDGFEMLKLLKEDLRTDHIPVVILTARGDFDSKLTGLETGADHYLIKPFSEKELLLKLNNLLELRANMQKHLGGVPFVSHSKSGVYQQEIQFIQRLNALIEAQMEDENFGISDVCRSFNMSRAQLYRKFSAITNNAIGHYLRSYRLHKAKELMEKQGKNVTEAAFQTGFKNLSHFSTCFREEFGCPPKAFTQRIR